MALKPWFKVVTPREDLREGRPLDASEFAVHLDQVRDGKAPDDYKNPERFFERTFLTKNLTSLAAEVIRRLSGEKTETNAVFNLTTPFGGGKTHALTLLYHLANHGPDANGWMGVKRVLEKAQIKSVPKAAIAAFVGTEFDSITGRGGDDGTPLRKTVWGEMAFQLGGKKSFEVVAEHDKENVAPAGEVIRKFLPKDKPCLILLDEVMNYVSRSRKKGVTDQLYNFLHNFSEVARGLDNVVLVVSMPASELEMGAEDQSDFERYKKLLDRLGKAEIMAEEGESSEIIRRRLFEWHGLPDDAKKTIAEYSHWIIDHRQQIPSWFSADNAKEIFSETYPFHPTVLSVFERKWRTLSRFQQTRGMLRLLALWVSKAYVDGFKGDHKDPLIGMGTAPLDEPMFRTALLEQLGELRLEGAVTTDICGSKSAHAIRLDNEAQDTIKKARLHKKVCTTIFIESNGGQLKDKAKATLPEIRLALSEPDLDIGNIETVIETLTSSCYYLTVEGSSYLFSLTPNLNKLLADRRASIQSQKIEERVRAEIQRVFVKGSEVERVFFPKKSSDIGDRPVLTFVVLDPDSSMNDKKSTTKMIETFTKEYGTSSRTFKSALIWCVPDSNDAMNEDARKALAWEEIADEQDELKIDDKQKRHLEESLKKANRDLTESVWRAYRYIMLLGKDNTIRTLDFGPVHSSQGDLISLMLARLRQDDEVIPSYSPIKLAKNWPPAIKEWNTKAVRDIFFASPVFPRLQNTQAVKETIAAGVSNGVFAYIGKTAKGEYDPFFFNKSLSPDDVEISEDMYIIQKEIAEAYSQGKTPIDKPGFELTPPIEHKPEEEPAKSKKGYSQKAKIKKITWSGEIPPQKWTNFYMKVLTKFSASGGLKLNLTAEIEPEGGISEHEIEEMKMALRELGLEDDVTIEK